MKPVHEPDFICLPACLLLAFTMLTSCILPRHFTEIHSPLPASPPDDLDANTRALSYSPNAISTRVPPATLAALQEADGDKFFEPVSIGDRTRLSIVEFDNHGMLRASHQLTGLMEHLIARPNGRPLLLVLFVHGWKHDASPHDANLASFRDMLWHLRKEENPRGDILGVYLAWPGNVSLYRGNTNRIVDFLRDFTYSNASFGPRYGAAQRVARVSCTEAMLSTILAAKVHEENGPVVQRKKGEVTTIVAGHSMGGLIVERSFFQAMLGYKIINAPTDDKIEDWHRTEEDIVNTKNEIIKKETPSREQKEKIAAALRAKLISADIKWGEDEKSTGIHDLRAQLDPLSDAPGSLAQRLKDVREQLRPHHRAAVLGDLQKKFGKIKAEANGTAEFDEVFNLLFSAWPDDPPGLWPRLDQLYRQLAEPKTATKENPAGTGGWADFYPESEATSFFLACQAVSQPKGLSLALHTAIIKIETSGNLTEAVRKKAAEELRGAFREYLPEDDDPNKKPLHAWIASAQEAENLIREFQKIRLAYSERFDAPYKKYLVERNVIDEEMQVVDASVVGLAKVIDEATKARDRAKDLKDQLDLVRKDPPADLILLINPASEALITEQARQVWEKGRIGERIPALRTNSQHPWVVSISSKSDTATGPIFTIGTNVTQGAWRTNRPSSGNERVSQYRLRTRTAPHIPEFWTHKVVPIKERSGSKEWAIEEIRAPAGPIWVVHDEANIISNHGDYWDKDFRRLVVDIFKKAHVVE